MNEKVNGEMENRRGVNNLPSLFSVLYKAAITKYNLFISFRSFPILEVHFPKYSTREIHRNYIDCVRWFGRLAFSKSCENSLILWRPPRPDDKPQEKSFQVLQK